MGKILDFYYNSPMIKIKIKIKLHPLLFMFPFLLASCSEPTNKNSKQTRIEGEGVYGQYPPLHPGQGNNFPGSGSGGEGSSPGTPPQADPPDYSGQINPACFSDTRRPSGQQLDPITRNVQVLGQNRFQGCQGSCPPYYSTYNDPVFAANYSSSTPQRNVLFRSDSVVQIRVAARPGPEGSSDYLGRSCRYQGIYSRLRMTVRLSIPISGSQFRPFYTHTFNNIEVNNCSPVLTLDTQLFQASDQPFIVEVHDLQWDRDCLSYLSQGRSCPAGKEWDPVPNEYCVLFDLQISTDEMRALN